MQYERRIMIQPIPGRIGVNVYIYTEHPDGSAEVMEGAERMTRVERGAPMKPTFYLEDVAMLQLFVDEAAKRGMKHQGGYTEGELVATKAHLEDMRKLVLDTPVVNVQAHG